MKVHILGKGIISLIGLNAPVRNIDLPEKKIRGLVLVPTLKVVDAATNLYINKNNVDQFFAVDETVVEKPKPSVKKSPKKNEVTEKVAKIATPVSVKEETAPVEIPAPVVEAVEAPVEEETVVEAVEELPSETLEEVEETTPVEEVVEEIEEVESIEEETTVPATYNNDVPIRRKNKKRR